MQVESVLVTGANRGIGLELVRQLVQLPEPPRWVFATYRDESTLKALKEIRDASKDTQVVLLKMDITQPSEVARGRQLVEERVGGRGLNLLINNSAVLQMEGFPDITAENLLLHFSTNTVGPVMVLKEFLPLLRRAAAQKSGGMSVSRAAVLNVSALGGSISELSEEHPRIYLSAMSYRTSKAALNMAMRVISLTIPEQGVLIFNMCPGWVKTDMGSDQAPLTVEESVSSILRTLPRLDESHHGTFMDRNGVLARY